MIETMIVGIISNEIQNGTHPTEKKIEMKRLLYNMFDNAEYSPSRGQSNRRDQFEATPWASHSSRSTLSRARFRWGRRSDKASASTA